LEYKQSLERNTGRTDLGGNINRILKHYSIPGNAKVFQDLYVVRKGMPFVVVLFLGQPIDGEAKLFIFLKGIGLTSV